MVHRAHRANREGGPEWAHDLSSGTLSRRCQRHDAHRGGLTRQVQGGFLVRSGEGPSADARALVALSARELMRPDDLRSRVLRWINDFGQRRRHGPSLNLEGHGTDGVREHHGCDGPGTLIGSPGKVGGTPRRARRGAIDPRDRSLTATAVRATRHAPVPSTRHVRTSSHSRRRPRASREYRP